MPKTKDSVREYLQKAVRTPDPDKSTLAEIRRLLNKELWCLISSGRAYEEMMWINAIITAANKPTAIPQAFVRWLHERCLLLIAIGVSRASSIRGGTDLGREFVRDGITEQEFEEVVVEILEPLVDK